MLMSGSRILLQSAENLIVHLRRSFYFTNATVMAAVFNHPVNSRLFVVFSHLGKNVVHLNMLHCGRLVVFFCVLVFEMFFYILLPADV